MKGPEHPCRCMRLVLYETAKVHGDGEAYLINTMLRPPSLASTIVSRRNLAAYPLIDWLANTSGAGLAFLHIAIFYGL